MDRRRALRVEVAKTIFGTCRKPGSSPSYPYLRRKCKNQSHARLALAFPRSGNSRFPLLSGRQIPSRRDEPGYAPIYCQTKLDGQGPSLGKGFSRTAWYRGRDRTASSPVSYTHLTLPTNREV